MSKWKVGDTVLHVRVSGGKDVVTKTKVTKVGRKFFYVDYAIVGRFLVVDGREDGFCTTRVFTQQGYRDEATRRDAIERLALVGVELPHGRRAREHAVEIWQAVRRIMMMGDL
jgi:hypothetical protein